MNPEINHFNCWKAFNSRVYKTTLTAEHLMNKGNELFLDMVTEINKQSDGTYKQREGKLINLPCIILEKNGNRYILPSRYKRDLPINPKASFLCFMKNYDKTIHHFIDTPTIAKITPEKTLDLKPFLDVFNPMNHSNPKVWTFLKLQAIASKAKGCKYRLCSKPATGKSSNDIILHSITCDNVRVSKPSLAKLETLFYYHQKVLPDEITSLTPTQVREVEPFFLTIADESPSFQKHSMASKHEMNDVNISQSSCIFTYNDPDSLSEGSKFFDDIWQNKAAFDSRYPALFLDGEILSEVPKVSNQQADIILTQNWDYYKRIAKNVVYYIHNMHKEIHGWDRRVCCLKGRHKANFEGVLDGLDVISDSQQEFDSWMLFVNDSVRKYKALTKPKDGGMGFLCQEEVIR